MNYSEVKPLPDPDYELLSSVTHCQHLREAINCYENKTFALRSFRSKTNPVNAKVVWFAPTGPMDQNNRYGNVSFTIDWKVVLSIAGPYLYYIDQETTQNHIRSRVLISSKSYNLPRVDYSQQSLPLSRTTDGTIFAAKQTTIFSFKKPHYMEFAIEADDSIAKSLFRECEIDCNDHCPSRQKNFCYYEECWNSLTRQQATVKLRKDYPGMLDSNHSSSPNYGGLGQMESLNTTVEKDEDLERAVKIGAVIVGGALIAAKLASLYFTDDNKDKKKQNQNSFLRFFEVASGWTNARAVYRSIL